MHISVNRISEADFCNKQLSRIETGKELETKNRTGTWPRLITKLLRVKIRLGRPARSRSQALSQVSEDLDSMFTQPEAAAGPRRCTVTANSESSSFKLNQRSPMAPPSR